MEVGRSEFIRLREKMKRKNANLQIGMKNAKRNRIQRFEYWFEYD